jgi:hypothetical protein
MSVEQTRDRRPSCRLSSENPKWSRILQHDEHDYSRRQDGSSSSAVTWIPKRLAVSNTYYLTGFQIATTIAPGLRVGDGQGRQRPSRACRQHFDGPVDQPSALRRGLVRAQAPRLGATICHFPSRKIFFPASATQIGSKPRWTLLPRELLR